MSARRYRWWCPRCRVPSRALPGALTPAEALRLGLAHYDLTHRDADTAAMAAAP